ncbi:MAG: hypothetical protein PHN99_02370 [Eubacteriales bacterium]|nr:hypothetical protein [Eubacteriales bacterium]
MKKILTILLAAVVTISFSVSTFAYKPIDGDIVDFWGQLDDYEGDSLVETADGLRLTFGRPMWAGRVGTLDTFKLDGLTITFKDVQISAANGMALGIGNTEGGWVDTKGIFFLHFTTTVSETLGDAPNGYMMAKQGVDLSDVNPRIIADTLHDKIPTGNFTVSFKKNDDGSWTYTFNGQAFPITKEAMDEHVQDQEDVYLYFGNWGQARGTIAYTIADMSETGSVSSVPASSSVTSSAVPQSSEAVSSVSAENSEEVSQDESAEDPEESVVDTSVDGSDENSSETVASEVESAESEEEPEDGDNTVRTIVIIIIIAALLGAVISGVLLVRKNKKA